MLDDLCAPRVPHEHVPYQMLKTHTARTLEQKDSKYRGPSSWKPPYSSADAAAETAKMARLVSVTDLAPCPRDSLNAENASVENDASCFMKVIQGIIDDADGSIVESVEQLRRSTRLRKKPERCGIHEDE